jgi:hypothetical protein
MLKLARPSGHLPCRTAIYVPRGLVGTTVDKSDLVDGLGVTLAELGKDSLSREIIAMAAAVVGVTCAT